MKKRALLILLCLSLFLLFGCSENSKISVSVDSSQDDTQPYWNIFNHGIAKGENGYYYLSDEEVGTKDLLSGQFIKYMEQDTGKTTYLCGKPDCNHRNSECNAYLKNEYANTKIYYYKGYIYLLEAVKEEGLAYLVKVKPDGSSRERLFDIDTLQADYTIACLTFMDDAVYSYTRQGSVTGLNENTAKIRRRSLDGKEDDVIYEYTGVGAVTYALKGYGGKLFFLVEEEQRQDKNSQLQQFYYKGLYVYDPEKKQVSQYIDANICDFSIDVENKVLYYFAVKDGLYKMNMVDNKTEKIYSYEKGQTDICQVSYDGAYLYVSNEIYPTVYMEKVESYKTYILDKDGKLVNEVTTAGPFCMFFGDSEYMFSNSEKLGSGKFQYIKKENISDLKDWTIMQ